MSDQIYPFTGDLNSRADCKGNPLDDRRVLVVDGDIASGAAFKILGQRFEPSPLRVLLPWHR